jgi:Transposase DDE domain
MRHLLFYNWFQAVRHTFSHLHKPTQQYLGLLTLGLLRSQAFSLTKQALSLSEYGQPATVHKRLKRAVQHPALAQPLNFSALTGLVLQQVRPQRVVLVIDETTLRDHVRVLMIGLAYRKRCLPLAWMCSDGKWESSQVERIDTLLRAIAAGLPPQCTPVILADRGIGTSPALMRLIQGFGWHFLLRVTDSAKFYTQQRWFTLAQLARPQRTRRFSGCLFKKRGRITDLTLWTIWKTPFPKPQCLVCNTSTLRPSLYQQRFWIEATFKDWKSRGFHWEDSRLWSARRTSAILLALALAYLFAARLSARLPPHTRRLYVWAAPISWFQLALRLFLAHPFLYFFKTVPP